MLVEHSVVLVSFVDFHFAIFTYNLVCSYWCVSTGKCGSPVKPHMWPRNSKIWGGRPMRWHSNSCGMWVWFQGFLEIQKDAHLNLRIHSPAQTFQPPNQNTWNFFCLFCDCLDFVLKWWSRAIVCVVIVVYEYNYQGLGRMGTCPDPSQWHPRVELQSHCMQEFSLFGLHLFQE